MDDPTAALLIIMARRPEPGRAKTRLCPPLTLEEAALLYEGMLRDTLELVRGLVEVSPAIAVSPVGSEEYFRTLAPDALLIDQGEGELGVRLAHTTATAFAYGARAVAVMSSDSPAVTPDALAQAFHLLADHDLVLGPSEDGGYYLAALCRPIPALFTEVTMSTPRVLHDTLAVATRLGLRVALLPLSYDVDSAADLVRLQADPAPLRHTRAALARIGGLKRERPLPPG